MDIPREAAKRQRSISDMLIRDLTPIGPEWESANRIDILKARAQHRAAVNEANAKALLAELEQSLPDSDFHDYNLDEIREHDEADDERE
jgi:hypothetical protein